MPKIQKKLNTVKKTHNNFNFQTEIKLNLEFNTSQNGV